MVLTDILVQPPLCFLSSKGSQNGISSVCSFALISRNNPTTDCSCQLPWSASLVVFSLGLYWRIFLLKPSISFLSSAWSQNGCSSDCSFPLATGFIWIAYTNGFNWFDVLDDNNLPVLTEREVLRNLQAIVRRWQDWQIQSKYFPSSGPVPHWQALLNY